MTNFCLQCSYKNISPNVDMCVQDGCTALMIAIKSDKAEVVQLLIERGAALDVQDKVCNSLIVYFLFY
jgi:hypothetical protein